MRYTYSEGVRQALEAARREAIEARHDYVGTEHILLGLLQVAEARPVLECLQLDRGEVHRLFQEVVRKGRAMLATDAALPYTSRAKKVLEFSIAEARELNHNHVDTSLLLLGLLRDEQGIAGQILKELGVTLDRARAAAFAPEARAPRSKFRVRVDDAAEVSIYEQIVAQVQEAVATGVLAAGERLPTVRQLADELDIAPGTVARAYGELERRGVVVTEGARGTRVADRQRKAVPDTIRPETLVGLLRPIAVAAFHLGATSSELRAALERAMHGIFSKGATDES